MKRPDWDNYFLNIAEDVASRTTCFSPQKGADCTKLIINAGINEVVYINDYLGSEAKIWFEEAGVKIRQHKEIKDAK